MVLGLSNRAPAHPPATGDDDDGVQPRPSMSMQGHHAGTVERTVLIGLIAFLSVIDLFGTQGLWCVIRP
jgi:hypothetical protein